jgi:hypothetical protein
MVGQILKQILIYLRNQMTDKSHEIPNGIAVAGCKIANLRRTNIMFNTLKGLFTKDQLVVTKTAKRTAKRVSRLTKTQRVLNLLSKGKPVSWKTLRDRFELATPRAMVDKLRSQGNMIYINKTAQGTSYRLGTPSKAIIAAGIQKLYGTKYAYSN